VTEPSHAVFLCYASQDAEDAQAAQRICEAFRAAGVEVWFDQSELRGGCASGACPSHGSEFAEIVLRTTLIAGTALPDAPRRGGDF
jgi:hypothetical protein